MNYTKILVTLSALISVVSLGIISFSIYNLNMVQAVIVMPVFMVSYPIAVVGVSVYMVKHALENMDIMDMVGMTGGLDVFGQGDENEGKTKESDEMLALDEAMDMIEEGPEEGEEGEEQEDESDKQ